MIQPKTKLLIETLSGELKEGPLLWGNEVTAVIQRQGQGYPGKVFQQRELHA